jgi:hypothetical protein
MLNNTNTVPPSASGGTNDGSVVGGSSILHHAHVEFLHCCVLAEQYRYAERLMRTDSWPRPTSMVSSKQVLRYFYLRGIVHLGCDHYRLAHRCFWTCLTVPAEVSSKIAIAAWKKLVLVQCLLQSKTAPAMKGATTGGNGSSGGGTSSGSSSTAMEALGFTEANVILSQPPPMASLGGSSGSNSSGATTMTYTTLPKTMPNCLVRFLMSYRDAATTAVQERSRQRRQQQQQQPPPQVHPAHPNEGQRQSQKPQVLNPISCYMDVSKAFYTRNQDTMKELEEHYQQTFLEDGNVGLVRQCQTKLIHMQVAHVARVYSVVPLTKLAEILLPAPTFSSSTEEERIQRVTRILCQAQIPCDIQDDGMVEFPSTEDEDDYDDDFEDDRPSLSLSDLSEWMSLMEKVQKLDVAIVTNSKYHAVLRKDAGELSAASVGPRGVEDL